MPSYHARALWSALAISMSLACREGSAPERLPSITAVREIAPSSMVSGLASAINAAGHVVGNGIDNPSGGFQRPFIWTRSGGARFLTTDSPSMHGVATAINDNDLVVGYADGSAIAWDRRGIAQRLASPSGARYSGAHGVSNDGTIVGDWLTPFDSVRPIAWTADGTLRPLAMPPGLPRVSAIAINDGGMILGRGTESEAGGFHTFVWSSLTSAAIEVLPPSGVIELIPYGLNDSGQVIGTLHLATGRARAFVWSASAGIRDLGVLPGTVDSYALAIGDGGHVVGYSDGRAFIWTESRGMRDLGQLALVNFNGAAAHGVNRFGQAVGYVRDAMLYRPVLFVTNP